MKWQPINTAPKNITDILLWHGRANVGGWSILAQCWVINGGYTVYPTHWCPIPEMVCD